MWSSGRSLPSFALALDKPRPLPGPEIPSSILFEGLTSNIEMNIRSVILPSTVDKERYESGRRERADSDREAPPAGIKLGRSSEADITICKLVGMGAQDLFGGVS
jgi:hypothetical protein